MTRDLAASLVRLLARAAPDDLPPPERSADEVKDTARDILSGREFRPPARNWIEEARAWVFEKAAELLGKAFAGTRGAVLAYALFTVAVVALLFFVVRLFRTVRSDPGAGLTFESDPIRPATAWRADAEVFEKRGEWRAALRCRYRALVADLASRGLVDEIPGRTTGEYRREVTTSVPRAAPEFSGATELFELAWYGNFPTGEAENRRFRSLADRVLHGVAA